MLETPNRPRIGEALINAGNLTIEQLRQALALQSKHGVRLGETLVHLGYVEEDRVTSELAEQTGIPFFDLRSAYAVPEVAAILPKDLAIERGVLPLYFDGNKLVVACADLPENCLSEEVLGYFPEHVVPVLTTRSALDEQLIALYAREFHEYSANELIRREPSNSANHVLSEGQQFGFIALIFALLLCLIVETVPTLVALSAISIIVYSACSIHKIYLMWRSLRHSLEITASPEELAALDDRSLPIYTILVPLYKEASILPTLVRAVGDLDYPKPKLDVKLLLEADDEETINAVKEMSLPHHFKIVIVPVGQPRGKPKACNYGLIHARGEYVVIFDAEDIPEPDQLKKTVIAFRKAGPEIGCIQAKLNYYNHNQNILTRWFTAEYSMWFDIVLPGLAATSAPIPLGGTSNHFPTALLRDLGAWDPYNVTDLGMRLFKLGYKTAVVESTTYEEANSEVYNWIRQRSRWIKGYIQTYLVHMRHPVQLLRSVGFRAFMSFQFVIGGTALVLLLNPIFWALTAIWFITKWWLVQELFPAAIFYPGLLALVLGNFTFTYVNVIGCLRRQHYSSIKYAIVSPLYWALMSIAAWKGFLQLFYAPYYWEKTNHGLHLASLKNFTPSLPVAPQAQSALRLEQGT